MLGNGKRERDRLRQEERRERRIAREKSVLFMIG